MSIRWYTAYSLSYRDVEELLEERGTGIDHATVNRWVIKYSPLLELSFRKRKKKVRGSWRMDETIKIKGQWFYYYRAVDTDNNTIDFYLAPTRNSVAAEAFFNKAISNSPYAKLAKQG